MTNVVVGAPDAGWYEDPQDAASMRWWDGTQWTTHVRATPSLAAPVTAEPVTAAPVTAEPAAAGFVAEPAVDRTPDYAALAARLEADTATTGPEMYVPPTPAHPLRPGGASAHTFSVWTLALLPIIVTGLGMIVQAISTAAGVGQGPATYGLGGVGLVLSVVLVGQDRAELERRGYSKPVSRWWLLLGTPVLLIVRAVGIRRQGGRSIAPPIVSGIISVISVGLLILAVGALLLVTGGTGATHEDGSPDLSSSTLVSSQVEASIEAALADQGETWQVDCTGQVTSLEPGTVFTCPATGVGEKGDVTVTVTPEQEFSFVLTVG